MLENGSPVLTRISRSPTGWFVPGQEHQGSTNPTHARTTYRSGICLIEGEALRGGTRLGPLHGRVIPKGSWTRLPSPLKFLPTTSGIPSLLILVAIDTERIPDGRARSSNLEEGYWPGSVDLNNSPSAPGKQNPRYHQTTYRNYCRKVQDFHVRSAHQ